MLELYDTLKERFKLGELKQQRDDLAFVTVDAANLHALLTHLQGVEGYTHLVLLTAVDWIEEKQFQLTYLVNNRDEACDIGVRVMLPRENTTMHTIHDIWPTAATYQRELREMFGIDFPGSPRVDEEFILEGWDDIPPYRREFDTKAYSDKTFAVREGRETHDPAQYMKQQREKGEG